MPSKTAILDYNAGNIESMRLALDHVGADPFITSDPAAIRAADRIVFPGVGSAAQCMRAIRARGFDKILEEAMLGGKPVLAVCIGIQLLFDVSEEDGGVEGLGLIPGRVVRFVRPPDDPSVKIPQMGWNRVEFLVPHPLLPPAGEGGDYYFVHSYYPVPAWSDPAVRHDPPLPDIEAGVVYGKCGHAGVDFAAVVGRRSFLAAQFHPEKSGEAGLEILERFKNWDGLPC